MITKHTPTFLWTFVHFLVALLLLRTAPAEEPNPRERLLASWSLAANAGMAMALYEAGARERVVKTFADAAAESAGKLGVALPPPPKRTKDPEADQQAVLNYLTTGMGKAMEAKLKDGPEVALAEIGLKSSVLLVLYVPGEETGKTLAKVIAGRASKCGIPDEIMADLLAKVTKGAPVQELRDTVSTMHETITKQLGGVPPKVAPLSQASEYLANAITSMGKAPGYRVRGLLTSPTDDKTQVVGAVAPGKMDVTIISADKKTTTKRVVVGNTAMQTTDDGKSWRLDTDAEAIIVLSNTLTSAVDPSLDLAGRANFEIIGEEKLGDEDVLHVQAKLKGEKDKEILHDYWIAKDPIYTTVVRRSRGPMNYGGEAVIADLVYTDIGRVEDIELPKIINR